MSDWHPLPLFYDVIDGAFHAPKDAYVPFGWVARLREQPAGNTSDWRPSGIGSFNDLLTSDEIWIEMWVELSDAASRQRFQAYMYA